MVFSIRLGWTQDFAGRLFSLEYSFSELELIMSSPERGDQDRLFLQISENNVKIDVFFGPLNAFIYWSSSNFHSKVSKVDEIETNLGNG